jgi:hypothetical protein
MNPPKLFIAPLLITIEGAEIDGQTLLFRLTEPRECFGVVRRTVEGRVSLLSLHDSEAEAAELLRGLDAQAVAVEGRGALQ